MSACEVNAKRVQCIWRGQGAEGPGAATEARPVLAERWFLHQPQPRAQEPSVDPRLRLPDDPRRHRTAFAQSESTSATASSLDYMTQAAFTTAQQTTAVLVPAEACALRRPTTGGPVAESGTECEVDRFSSHGEPR